MVRKGDYGFHLDFNFERDLTDASEVVVVIRRPDGTALRLSYASQDFSLPDPEAGRGRYVVRRGDLTQPGTYEVQAAAVFPNEGRHSSVAKFVVGDTIAKGML